MWFNRAPLTFLKTDTTKKPGFASIFHEVLSLGATYDWEKAKGKGNPEQTMRDIMQYKRDIKRHYGRRDKYEITKLKRLAKNFK